jgi:SAM-dependent methyltransferase
MRSARSSDCTQTTGGANSHRLSDRLLNTNVVRTRPKTERAPIRRPGVRVRNVMAPITLVFEARCHVTTAQLYVARGCTVLCSAVSLTRPAFCADVLCPSAVVPGWCGWLLSLAMDVARQNLRAYYEEEARLRLRKPVAGGRVELRDEFVTLLEAESRRSIVDFGAGPGRDGEAFIAAGFNFVGLDLAHANTVLASQRGVRVVQGSIDAPPFQQRAFDAGWSMSTLMHFRAVDVPETLSAMTAPLRQGAPLFVGVWGGDQGDIIGEFGLDGHQRLFSLRPFEVNLRLFAACGDVEHATTWDYGPDEWQYQVFKLRVGR